MTRFERELNGLHGNFRKRNAEQEIEKMQERADNFEIRLNMNGAAFWNSNGNYLDEECSEILSHTTFEFSLEETAKAREAQTKAFLEDYRANHKVTEEDKAEMRAAFGEGTTVVDAITGEKITL